MLYAVNPVRPYCFIRIPILLQTSKPRIVKPIQFWTLFCFLIALAFTGGSSRSDVQSLAFLLPLSIIVCAIGLWTLELSHVKNNRYVLISCALTFFLVCVQLVPLPPEIWRWQSSMSNLLELAVGEGERELWRPLSVAPWEGWTSVSFLIPPLAVIFLAIQLKNSDLYRLIPLLVGLGALSSFLGLMQIVSGSEASFHLYSITNRDSAVGLFANRNHAALFLACLLPILAVFSAQNIHGGRPQKNRSMIAAAIAIVIVPLVLVTGSRSGFITALIGFIGAAAIYLSGVRILPGENDKAYKKLLPLAIVLITISLILITLAFSRAEAIDRLLFQDSVNDQRSQFWIASLQFLFAFGFWGAGAGSFASVYEFYEPITLLDSTYLNSAHNDYLEIAHNFGIAGVSCLAIGVIALIWRTFDLWFRQDGRRNSVMIARMGGYVIFMMAGASIVDYPLRTPLMISIFALMLLWFFKAESVSASAKSLEN